MLVHMDGAEFYSNSEFYVWSISSLLASGETEVGLVKHVETCNWFFLQKMRCQTGVGCEVSHMHCSAYVDAGYQCQRPSNSNRLEYP